MNLGGVNLSWKDLSIKDRKRKNIKPLALSDKLQDKNLAKVMKLFVGDDLLRPVMAGINYTDEGVIHATNAHKVISIHHKLNVDPGTYLLKNTLTKAKFNNLIEESYVSNEFPHEIEFKYPNVSAVYPPADSDFKSFPVDFEKLYTFCMAIQPIVNKVTKSAVFKYGENDYISFNTEFLSDVLKAMMYLNHSKGYIHLTENNKMASFTINSKRKPFEDEKIIASLMPVSLYDDDEDLGKYGVVDLDNNNYFTSIYDFTKDDIIEGGKPLNVDFDNPIEYNVNGNITAIQKKRIEALSKGNKSISILEHFIVKSNTAYASDLEIHYAIPDAGLSDGVKTILKNTIAEENEQNIDDYPNKFKSNELTNQLTGEIDIETLIYVSKICRSDKQNDLPPQYELQNIWIYADDDDAIAVATDAYRLVKIKLGKAHENLKKGPGIMVPGKLFNNWITATKINKGDTVTFYETSDEEFIGGIFNDQSYFLAQKIYFDGGFMNEPRLFIKTSKIIENALTNKSQFNVYTSDLKTLIESAEKVKFQGDDEIKHKYLLFDNDPKTALEKISIEGNNDNSKTFISSNKILTLDNTHITDKSKSIKNQFVFILMGFVSKYADNENDFSKIGFNTKLINDSLPFLKNQNNADILIDPQRLIKHEIDSSERPALAITYPNQIKPTAKKPSKSLKLKAKAQSQRIRVLALKS